LPNNTEIYFLANEPLDQSYREENEVKDTPEKAVVDGISYESR
jgi:hypothetical protein